MSLPVSLPWIPLPILGADSWHYDELTGAQTLLTHATLTIGYERSRTRRDRYIAALRLGLDAAASRPVTALRIYIERNAAAPSLTCFLSAVPAAVSPGIPAPTGGLTGDTFLLRADGAASQPYGPGSGSWGALTPAAVGGIAALGSAFTGIVIGHGLAPVEVCRPDAEGGLRVEARLGRRTAPHAWGSAAASGVPMRASDILELRAAIDGVRAAYGLPGTAWSDGAAAGLPIRAADMNQLRDALAACSEVLSAADPDADLPPPPPVFAQGAPARAADLLALRALADAL